MAHAFYIPNQAALLRRTYLQEQRLKDNYKSFWRLMLTLFCELLHQYVQHERRAMGSCRPSRCL